MSIKTPIMMIVMTLMSPNNAVDADGDSHNNALGYKLE